MRAPESKRLTLKDTLAKDLAHVSRIGLSEDPEQRGDNREFFGTLPAGPAILEFFHRPSTSPLRLPRCTRDHIFATRHKFEYLRERLLTEDDGAKAVFGALEYLRRENRSRSGSRRP